MCARIRLFGLYRPGQALGRNGIRRREGVERHRPARAAMPSRVEKQFEQEITEETEHFDSLQNANCKLQISDCASQT
jgi:hypothetical protein